MSQIDAFKNTFKCNLCSGLVEKPILLPCGETICEKDLKTFFENSLDRFQCTLCDEEHELPKKGFPSNKSLQKLLDLQVNQIDFNRSHPKYQECKNKLEEVEEKMKEIQLIEADPENFVCSYFENIINQVDIQREKLVEEIHLYSEKTIETIKKAKDECLLIDKKIELIPRECENLKENLLKLNQELNSFDINEKKIEQIITNIDQINPILIKEFIQIQNKLLSNKSYEFKPMQVNTLKMQDLIGTFITQKNEVCLFYF